MGTQHHGHVPWAGGAAAPQPVAPWWLQVVTRGPQTLVVTPGTGFAPSPFASGSRACISPQGGAASPGPYTVLRMEREEGHEGGRPSLTSPKGMKTLPGGTREPETLSAIIVWSKRSQAGEDQGENGPAVVRRPRLLRCLPARPPFLMGKIHPGKGEPGAILQHDLERKSRIEEGSLGCEPISFAGSQGSLLLVGTLTITTSHVTMSQTQLASTISLLPAKCG